MIQRHVGRGVVSVLCVAIGEFEATNAHDTPPFCFFFTDTGGRVSPAHEAWVLPSQDLRAAAEAGNNLEGFTQMLAEFATGLEAIVEEHGGLVTRPRPSLCPNTNPDSSRLASGRLALGGHGDRFLPMPAPALPRSPGGG